MGEENTDEHIRDISIYNLAQEDSRQRWQDRW